MKKLLLLLVISVLITACQLSDYENNSAISLDPSDLEIFKGSLDEILTIEKIVPLETKPGALLGGIWGFAQSETGILIRNKGNKSFFIYDEDGSFRTKIAKEGKGPGEYIESFGQDWITSVDNKEEDLVISDVYGKKLLFFSSEGEFISEAKIPYRIHSVASVSPHYILCHKGRFPFMGGKSETAYELIVLDREGKEIKKYFTFKESLLFELGAGFSLGINGSGKTYYKQLDPTIFQINQDLRLDTLWKFDFGALNPDTGYLMVPGVEGGERVGKTLESNPFLYIGRMIQNNKTLLVSHYYKKTPHNIFINNKSHNIFTLASDSLDHIGLWNNFPVKAPEWAFRESFIYESTAIDFIELLDGMNEAEKSILRKKIPGFSEAEGLSIEDNPVLVYFRVKDF